MLHMLSDQSSHTNIRTKYTRKYKIHAMAMVATGIHFVYLAEYGQCVL